MRLQYFYPRQQNESAKKPCLRENVPQLAVLTLDDGTEIEAWGATRLQARANLARSLKTNEKFRNAPLVVDDGTPKPLILSPFNGFSK